MNIMAFQIISNATVCQTIVESSTLAAICEDSPLVGSIFLVQTDSNAESFSMTWHHFGDFVIYFDVSYQDCVPCLF